MSPKKAEVVILGGGAIGFSIAYHLAKEGICSQVIEMDSIGAKASGASMGCIGSAAGSVLYLGSFLPSDARAAAIPLHEEGSVRMKQLHSELKEMGGLNIRYTDTPCLFCAIFKEEENMLKKLVTEAKNRGFKATWLTGDEARAKETTLSTEIRGAAFVDYGHVDAYRYTLALAQGAERLGCSISLAKAVGFQCQGKKVTSVVLDTREVAAETVVIAMGPWSGQAGSWLGVKIPQMVVRAQAVKLQTPMHPEYQTSYTPPAVGEWPRHYVFISPRVDGSVLAGYTEDRPTTWDDSRPETWEDIPTQDMKELIIEWAARLQPPIEEAMLVECRHALLGYPPDLGPIIGSLNEWENVYIATGMSDSGIICSPTVGRIITSLIAGGTRAKKAVEQWEPLSPNRFA